ncbi:ABC transporter substrate-binding protein [Citricoccus sp. GCM10030269]|uniref:ABC transporter substrate-binding protein n=1 Tax=Citricoccus sp. GCM10030269 TaxID=3273388 RepID=UPI00360BD441
MNRRNKRRGVWGSATLLAASLVLAGCGGGTAAEGGGGTSEGGVPSVTAATIPVTDAGPIFLSEDQGIWEDHNLDLTIETANSSPNIISAIMSGDYQIGYGGVTSVFQAVENGIDLQIIAPASATADDPENGINDILVLPDSDFQTAADLEGRKVAVNALGGYAQLLAMIAIKEEGGNPDNVEWIELPVPDQPAALENGNIDAFVAGEPFGTLGRQNGLKTLANPHALLSDGAVVGGVWYANRAEVEANPEYYEDIVDAINETNTYAGENDEELRMAIADLTGIDQDLAAEIRLGSYGKYDLSKENIQPLADAAVEFGLVQNPPDLDSMIWKP